MLFRIFAPPKKNSQRFKNASFFLQCLTEYIPPSHTTCKQPRQSFAVSYFDQIQIQQKLF